MQRQDPLPSSGGKSERHDGGSSRCRCEEKYSQDTCTTVRYMYVIMAVIWVIIVMALDIKMDDMIMVGVLLIPLAVFLVNSWSVDRLDNSIHSNLFKVNLFTVSILAASFFLGLVRLSDRKFADVKGNYVILITAFIFALLSAVDVIADKDGYPIVVHLRSSLQTFALALFIAAIYLFYKVIVSTSSGVLQGGGVEGGLALAAS